MILVEPTGSGGYSPRIGCSTCPVQLSLNRYALAVVTHYLCNHVRLDPANDPHEDRELDRLLAAVAKADGWYTRPDGEWLCDVCAPSAVERLGELADDRP